MGTAWGKIGGRRAWKVLAALSGVRGQSRERQVRWMGEQGPDLEGQRGCVIPSYGHQKCPGLLEG